MLNTIKNLIKDEEGATMVEYALMVALIAVIALTAVGLLGNKVKNTFTNANNAM